MEKERIYNISELFQSIDLQCIAPEDVIRRLFQSPTWFSYVNDRLVYKDFIMQQITILYYIQTLTIVRY